MAKSCAAMVWRWPTVTVVRRGMDMAWRLDGCISMQNLDVVRGGNRIAMIDCDNEALSDGDIMTNARLIAAAPELLAALEAVTACLRGFHAAEDFGPLDDEAIEAALSAIAKAKGEA